MATAVFFIFVFGLCIGSFINCFVWRLHQGETMLNRSYCPRCRRQIAWYDNIPLVSFVCLRGRCRHCRQPISWQYPLVEFITAVLFVLVFIVLVHNFQFSIIELLRNWFFISVLTVIFIYDWRWYLIEDIITLPAIAIALVINFYLGASALNLLVAAVVGGGFFFFQYVISHGRWIGGGDIRLGVFMGIALGWPIVLVALILAYFSGSVISLGLLAFGKKKWSSPVPFGTFLSAAAIIALLWGDKIFAWYMGLMFL